VGKGWEKGADAGGGIAYPVSFSVTLAGRFYLIPSRESGAWIRAAVPMRTIAGTPNTGGYRLYAGIGF
jgi:hypothetical protein